MISLLLNSFKDFKRTYKKYLLFEVIYMLMTGFIFVPLIAYIFNRLLMALGSNVLLNKEVFKIVLSYRGIAGLLTIASIAVIIIFIEFGVLIVISQKKFFSKDILISEAVVTTIKSVPKILGFGMLHLIFILLFLMPFIDSPLSPALIDRIEKPLFIKEAIFEINTLYIIYLASIIAVVYLLLRWMFALHYIIIEGKATKDAILSSIELTRHNRTIILLKLLLLNIAFLAIGFAVVFIIALIPFLGDLDVSYFLRNYLITFSSFITFILALLLTPINIIFLTRLYYQRKMKMNHQLKDELIAYESKFFRRLDIKLKSIFNKRKGLIIVFTVIYFIGAFLFTNYVSDNIINIGRNVLIAAHRGDPVNAPENSLSSIRAAIEQEVDFVEIDVQVTKDGVVVLNHDANLMRVAGIPDMVLNLTYEEIFKLDIGAWFSEEFVGERIATLEEALEVARGKAKVIVEIKPYGDSKYLAQRVMEVIEKSDMVEDCYIQSFDYNILQEVRKINKDIKIGQVMYFALGNLSTIDVDFYAIETRLLSRNFIKNARKYNREVWVWTVNEEEIIKEVLKYDIDGVITDYVDRVQKIIGKNLTPSPLNN